MFEKLTDLTFEEWVYHMFDHPEAWYFAIGSEYWDGPPEVAVEYVTRLFTDPHPHLDGYTDDELKRGFWYLLSNGGSDVMFAISDPRVPLEKRLACIETFYIVLRDFFVPRCSPHLSHLDEPGVNPLNSPCYMWWDITPVPSGASDEDQGPLTDACLSVMERTLALDSIACQENALHGLGHWHRHFPERVESIIDAFLAAHPDIRPELKNYALSARGGCVQ